MSSPERFKRRLLHDLIVRRKPAGEQATLRELDRLLSDGVLAEPAQ